MDKVELRSCLKTPKICEVNEYSEVSSPAYGRYDSSLIISIAVMRLQTNNGSLTTFILIAAYFLSAFGIYLHDINLMNLR